MSALGRFAFTSTILSVLLLAGCLAEDGVGLGPTTTAVATFSSIQESIFAVHCTQCHMGPGAPEGLRLDETNAYNDLVGTASGGKPTFLRVNPGNPETSYLILKLTGDAQIVGERMPSNGPPYLSETDIDTIRIWIEDGAQP